MDAKNFEYLQNKVLTYEKLGYLKDRLNSMQESLVRDYRLTVIVKDKNNDSILISDDDARRFDDYEVLMREIKDNLIDAIGMKIVEIEEKMKEL